MFRGEALDAALEEQCTVHRRSLIRLQKLPSQSALTLMRSSFSVPRIGYLLRCSPCTGHHLLGTFDELQRTGLGAITNCSLNETQWLQASLPVRDGGLGVRIINNKSGISVASTGGSGRAGGMRGGAPRGQTLSRGN